MSYPTIPLGDAVVLVTGGARGIGAATAELFLAHGATVWVGDLDTDAVRADGRLHTHPLDVTDRASFTAVAEAALDAHGRIDVLVNNAGVMPLGDFLTEPDSVAATTFDVNVWGLVNGMRSVMPHMLERGRGHVVNVASMAGKIALPGMAVYNASKFAAVGLSLAVREEYAGAGVSVSTVLPSAVRTRLSSGVPLGRGLPTVDPVDIARAVVGTVRHRRAENPVPGYLAGWDLINAVVPEPVMRLSRRAVGARRALTSVDPTIRAAYDQAVDSQARNRRQGASS